MGIRCSDPEIRPRPRSRPIRRVWSSCGPKLRLNSRLLPSRTHIAGFLLVQTERIHDQAGHTVGEHGGELLREGRRSGALAPAGPGRTGGLAHQDRTRARGGARTAGVARRSWATLFVALLRAKPGPERSGGTRPESQTCSI